MKRVVLLVCLVLGAVLPLEAQDLFYRKNLANIRVDNLSQDQVIKFQQQIQTSNMSGQEMEAYLRSKGLSREEIAKLKGRMGGLGNTDAAKDFYNIELMNDYFKLRDSLKATGWDPDAEVGNKPVYARTMEVADSAIFGSELFANSKFSFTPDIPVASPVNYVLGPGDVLLMTIYGVQEQMNEIKISPEGTANVPYGGVMAVSGLTIEQATQRIRQTLIRNGYASMATGDTKLQLTINEFRSFHVTVIGAKNAGVYLVPSVATAFHLLHVAGGPSKQGTYRAIEIIRKGKVVQKLDLYDFLVTGNLSGNITLQENDVINIPAFENRVQLKGEFKRVGLFELKEGESFSRLLDYCGGFTPLAFKDRIYVELVTEQEFSTRDILADAFDNYEPASGDVIRVGSVLNRYVNRIAASGAVMRPGYYGWEQGMQLKTLLERAGGLKESALLTRGLIFRAGRDNEKAYLRFIPQDILDGTQQLVLEDGDSVIIGDKFALFPEQQIKAIGEVNEEGSFIFGQGMTAMDAILMAGGMKRSAESNRIEIARRQAGTGDMVIAKVLEAQTDVELMVKADEVVLEPLDVVIVRPNPSYQPQRVVRLEGEVLYPGSYVLLKRQEKLSSIIGRAGGLTNLADPYSTFIIREGRNPFYLKAKREMEGRELATKKRALGMGNEDDNKSEIDYMSEADSVLIDTISVDVSALFGKGRKKYDIDLKDGDIIHVLVNNSTISVKGEVNSQVTINYTGAKLKPYLRDAGGTLKNADKKRVYVVAPNGRARSTKQFMGIRSYPKVVPGSVVVVPPKPNLDDGPRDPARLAAVSSILASTSGLLFVIITLVR